MENSTFTFTSQNPKASRYLLICLISFIAPFGVSFLNFFLLITLVAGAMALGLFLFSRHTKASEQIRLYEAHLHSEIFGEVYYKEIISAKPVVVDTGRGLRLKLSNGKKAWWLCLKKDENPEYEKFVAALSEAVSHVVVDENTILNQKGKVRPENIGTDVTTGIEEYRNEQESNPEVAPAQRSVSEIGLELKNVQKKNSGSGNSTTIISGLTLFVLALFGLFMIYAPKWEQARNDRAMRPFREAVGSHLVEKANLQDSVQKVINKYTEDNGPYFLYSNDTAAILNYSPVIQFDDQPTGGIRSLVLDNESDKLKAFLANPDSVSWTMALNTGGQGYYLTDDYSLNTENADAKVYFTLVNKDVRIPAPDLNSPLDEQDGQDSIPLQLEFAVQLNTDDDLQKEIREGLNVLKPFFKKHPETMKFYLAARQGEGRMDKALFEKATRVLTVQLAQMQVDTAGFKEKVF